MTYIFQKKREELIEKIAKTYLEWVLPIISSDDYMLSYGIREGTNKFLSNAYINSFKISYKNPYKGCKKKWLITDYISNEAKSKLKNKEYKGLQFEHMVPKAVYQKHFINEFKNNRENLTVKYISDILNSCWMLATVTEDEHRTLESAEEKEWTLEYYIKNNKIIYTKANIIIEENALIIDKIVTIK